MVEYRTELLDLPTALKGGLSDKDTSLLNGLISERAAEGWELVTYVLSMPGATRTLGASQFVVTFKKQK